MDLKVTEGITPNQINDLILYSNTDPLIKLTTHDPERFKNTSSFNKWMKKERSIYTLTDDSKKLFGIIWFGKEHFPNNKKLTKNIYIDKYNFTFAIRIYSDARGKGYAVNFVKEAFSIFKKTNIYLNSEHKGVWLETYASNLPAVKTYTHFGFTQVSDPDNAGRIIMTLPLNS